MSLFVLALLFPIESNAKFYKHPDEIFVIEYPDNWKSQDSRFHDSFAIASDEALGIARCSFRADSVPSIKNKKAGTLVDALLGNDAYINEMRRGIPSAQIIKKNKVHSLNAPIFIAVYEYNLNYNDEILPMKAIGVMA